MRTYLNPEEKRLVKRCIRGELEAQKQLYHKYVKAMYNLVIRMVSNKMDTEDIIQESFIKVFQKIASFKGESTLGAWIKRITINTALNHIRKNGKIEFSEIDKIPHLPETKEESYWSNISLPKVHEAIKALPEGSRVVFSLYLLEGYQHKEIASILGISESTSKSQYQRARKLLQKQLRKMTAVLTLLLIGIALI